MVIIISGPSGVGKSYLCWEIVTDFDNFFTPKKYTTRKQRNNEDNREYIFVSSKKFHKLKQENYFDICTEIYGNWYGISKIDLLKTQTMNAIFILDVFIAQKVKHLFNDTVLVYIMPDNKEKLITYLKKRSLEFNEDYNSRVNLIEEELAEYDKFDYCIPSFNSEDTYQFLKNIIASESCRPNYYNDMKNLDLISKNKIPRIAVDLVVYNKRLKSICLISRAKEPFGLALPGGFVNYGEPLHKAAIRELREEVGVITSDIEFIDIFSNPNRDPRKHVISASYYLEFQGKLNVGGDAKNASWVSLDNKELNLLFDHSEIIEKARDKFNF